MLNMDTLGTYLRKKRGNAGVRQIANEIGISPATLSRVENGNLPDIETFKKICDWLKVDPGEVLGNPKKPKKNDEFTFEAHLKAKRNIPLETANALATMILYTHKMFSRDE